MEGARDIRRHWDYVGVEVLSLLAFSGSGVESWQLVIQFETGSTISRSLAGGVIILFDDNRTFYRVT